MNRAARDELRLRLQASRIELLEDIEARQLDVDMATTPRSPAPEIVFKTRDNGTGSGTAAATNNGGVEPEPFDDTQIDIIAQALADLRGDFLAVLEAQLAPLRAELSELRGLLAMIAEKRKALGRKRATHLLPPPK